ncbi:uncharacterized protein LOC128209887 isoform X2 [Mya arenaria]|uniref:uncharacterized protein LOC128209887 isoform X2 n=1 Tax=Mya arenaria TaxID=6604 RepID=UPI0022E1D236|nr:uncharacterized protein LOC128209887 isoform X2 [Mya arenaria]
MATGFSASVLNAGDFEYDFPCTECQEHGLNSEAVYFCQQCDSQFCGLCVKQHDRFYQKHPIIGTEKNETWGKVKSTCKMHPGEEMTVFCSDHRQTCCVTCQKELHGQCQLLQHTSLKLPPRPSSVKIGETNLFHDCDHVSYLADQLYVASNRTVYQYTLTGQRVRKMDGWDMWGFALNPDGNRLYITDFDNNRLLTTDMHGRGLAILADEDIKGPTDGRRLQICVIHGRPTLCII